jgi:tetratricopeptide (TPR) repeat protein
MIEEAGNPVAEAHGELSLARVALAENDLRHAANHLTGAIAHAPNLPEVHELLAELASRRPDGGLSLFSLDQHVFVGTVVARAHLLAATDPGAALMLVAQATAHDPGRPWADVLWVQTLDVRTVDPDLLVQTLLRVMQAFNDLADPTVREANEVYLDLARRAVAGHPDHALLNGAAAGVGRRLGAAALAVRWGERGWRLGPNKLTAVWYAYALKADGQLDKGLRVLREAHRSNPLDLDICADMANWLTEVGRLDEALTVLEEALRIDPSYDCAVHTAHRLRYQRDGDPRHLVELVDFMRANPVQSHEHSDLADSCRGRYWLGVITGPTEACMNVLAQIPPERRAGTTKLSLSGLEVPSALALLRRECPGVRVEIAGPPRADMVNPRRPGPALWRYDATSAQPAVAAPSASAARLLTDTAMPIWSHPVAAYDHALPLGQLPAGELLALLVHPPARPDHQADIPAGYWERCAQVFACLGILHCQELSGTDPGDTSAPRRLLTEIAFGIEDWTVEAALFALTVSAWLDPSCRDEVRGTVGERFLAAMECARHRPVTILDSLAELVRIVPGMIPEVTALAEDVLRAPEEDRAADPAPVPAKRSVLRRLLGRGTR